VNGLESFAEIWCVDTEYSAPPGHRPTPICLVAQELRSGRQLRLWEDQLAQLRAAPFRTDDRALFVAYAAAAEFSVFRQLGWPAPERTLDLFFEFRALTNGLQTPSGSGLLGAMVYHGLPVMDAAEKESMRQLAIRGGPFTDAEREALLTYCAEDVAALARLLPAMMPRVDLPRALLRGRYAWAVAAMEHRGIPLDVPTFEHLKGRWSAVRAQLVAEVDQRYHVFDGTTFKRDRFARYLVERKIPWPMLETGQLDLSDDTFRSQAKAHPPVAELRELRAALGQMRLFEDLSIGPDGRNRTSIAPFRARTGRNQPSNAKFIFGPSRWLRSLIRPAPGMAVAYLDFISQEIAVGAALSGDTAMLEAYSSGDFYLSFAKQAGAVPADATKATHGEARSLFKAAALAVMYGMGPESLAQKIGKPTATAAELLALHRRTYPAFWKWSQAAVDRATLTGQIRTVFGWPLKIGPSTDPMRPATNPRALSNFPVQGNAAEMLRLACCLLAERGVGLCCPVHDAVLVEGPTDQIEDVVAQTRAAMAEASRVVLRGFEIGADAKIVSWPERYVDDAGAAFWETVMRLAGPGPQISSPDDVVRHDGRSSSPQRPNRSGLLRQSSKGVFFSSSTDGGGK
jgi:DNA polymerase I